MDSTNVEVRWKELPSSPFKAFCPVLAKFRQIQKVWGLTTQNKEAELTVGAGKPRVWTLEEPRGQREGLRAGLGPAQSPQGSLEVEVSGHPRRSY